VIKRLTNSEVGTFKDCRRKWYLGWFRHLRIGVEPITSAAKLGTRVHECLACWYDPADVRDPLAVLEAGYERDVELCADNPLKLKDLEKEIKLARRMVEGYFEWMAESGADQGLTVIGVEEKVEVPYPIAEEFIAPAGWSEVRLMGKLDMRIHREQDGALLFLDHKTVGSLNQGEQLELDEQMQHYTLIHRLLVEQGAVEERRSDGALYNMLRKVMRTATATPPFYGRTEVRVTDKRLRNFHARKFGELLDIARLEQQLNAGADHRTIAYPHPTRDCEWKCEFLPVCGMFDRDEDAEGFLRAFYHEQDPLDRYEELEINADAN